MWRWTPAHRWIDGGGNKLRRDAASRHMRTRARRSAADTRTSRDGEDNAAAKAQIHMWDLVILHIGCSGTVGAIRWQRHRMVKACNERAHVWSRLLATPRGHRSSQGQGSRDCTRRARWAGDTMSEAGEQSSRHTRKVVSRCNQATSAFRSQCHGFRRTGPPRAG